MPWGDWQFWVVSLLAVLAVWVLMRAIVPRRKKTGRRVRLTIGRKHH
jgi:hypothetical protein